MASVPSKPILLRLRPVLVAYLDELDRVGGFGKGRAAIVRRFVENGILREIRRGTIAKKNAGDLGESIGSDEEA